MREHVFSAREALRIAVEMERRGEAFYRRAAGFSTDPGAVKALNQLAADERAHCAEFMRMARQESVTEDAYDPEVSAYLTAVAADVVFSEGLVALRNTGFDDPRQVILEAIRSEKDSILFYTELAGLGAGAEIFNEIIRQEKAHLRMLQRRLGDLEAED